MTLETLTPSELLVMLRHLELGDSHLKETLSERELDQLLLREPLKASSSSKLETDKPELAGVVFGVLNSVFTATVGLWMGLSGFVGASLHSWPQLVGVFTVAIGGGLIIGYQNFKFTKRNAAAAIRKEKIQALQMDVLDEVEEKRLEEINQNKRELNALIKKIQIQKDAEPFTIDFNDKKSLKEGIDKLDEILGNNIIFYRNSESYRVFEKEIDETRKLLEDSLKIYEQPKLKHDRAVQKLTKEGPDTVPHASWFESNFKNLLVGLLPTLFGAFGSTFVYFSGVPQIAKEFGQRDVYFMLTSPEMKKIELISSTLITAYFLFNYLYLNYKSFLRDREFEEMEERLVKKKNDVRKLDDNLLKMKEVREHLSRITQIFEHIKQLTHA